MIHEFKTKGETSEFIRKLKEIMSEPRFRMWLRELITEEIRKHNENNNPIQNANC